MVLGLVIASLAGVGIGLLSGLLGIGGGTVIVPLLLLGFGFAAIEATAATLCAIIPPSVAGVVGHFGHRTCVVGVGVAAGLAGALTSPIGVQLADRSPSWAIMLAAALVIGYSAVTMLKKALVSSHVTSSHAASPHVPHAMPSQDASPHVASSHAVSPYVAQESIGKSINALRVHATCHQILVGALSGLIAGLASGYVGVGGGFIMVPLFVSFAGISMKQSSGTSLIGVAILAIPGVISQMTLGNVQVLPGLALALGSVPGALWGARLVQVIPERSLRLLFGMVLVLMVCAVVFNEVFSLIVG